MQTWDDVKMKNSLIYSADYVTEFAVCDFVSRVCKIAGSDYSFAMSVRLSVCPHGTTRLPLDELFLKKLIFEYFVKI